MGNEAIAGVDSVEDVVDRQKALDRENGYELVLENVTATKETLVNILKELTKTLPEDRLNLHSMNMWVDGKPFPIKLSITMISMGQSYFKESIFNQAALKDLDDNAEFTFSLTVEVKDDTSTEIFVN